MTDKFLYPASACVCMCVSLSPLGPHRLRTTGCTTFIRLPAILAYYILYRYMVERNCKLAQIGGLLDNKGYGIVMKKSILSNIVCD